ncbi:hypothetical protein [Anaeromyxobacter terrae]|uniref:hypothetical protein n=1 Tax=Anaeromyxobacter terrae TaxID=2925406 RepID=UPI001F5AFEB4|nr:hypothetical protein [Anaeromyxobacter sp. SG22]
MPSLPRSSALPAAGAEERLPGVVLVPIAALALAFGLGWSDGFLDPVGLVLVSLSLAAVVAALLVGRPAGRADGAGARSGTPWSSRILWAGVAASVVYDAIVVPGYFVPPETLGAFRPVLAVAAVAVLSYLWARAPAPVVRFRFPVLVGVAAVLGGIVIRASPRPPIDVWYFQQIGSLAIMRGVDPYLVAYPNIYGPFTPYYAASLLSPDHAYVLGNPYPPLTLLLAIPTALLEADVRWTMLALVLFSAWAVRRLGRGSRAAELAAVLVLLQPRTFFVVEQSWTEPTVLASTLLALLAVEASSRREASPGGAGVIGWIVTGLAGAVALSSKQYAPLLLAPVLFALPAARRWKTAALAVAGAALVLLPFAVWDAPALYRSIVAFQLEQPFRPDSLSWPALVVRGGGPILPAWPAALIAAATMALAAVRRPLSLERAVLAGAAAWLAFVVFSKQAFCNYYWLVVGLFCAAVALRAGSDSAAASRPAPEEPSSSVVAGRAAPEQSAAR